MFAGQLDVDISAGAGSFIVLKCDMMRMSGPPRRPQSEAIDLVDGGITGLR